IRRGAGGGRIQQVMAVTLTYLAVVSTYVPDLYAELSTSGPGWLALAVSVGSAIAWVVFAAVNGDILWFVIVGIALGSAWQRTGRARISWAGPFDAVPAGGP
ncbi:MAG: hypothetical protein ABMB14_08095, partial [Myxococcota bacterium]